MSAEGIIDRILEREGSEYTDRPADRGGPTRWGITQATLSEYLGRSVTEVEVRQLPVGVARDIYRFRYILQPKFDRIDDPLLRELVVDCGVNHGTRHPTKWLQQALGVTADGVIGAVTLQAMTTANPRHLYFKVLARRVRLYGRLVSADPVLKRARQDGYHLQAEHSAGWNNRAAEFIEAAAEW